MELLEETLAEEKETDEKLADIASRINLAAEEEDVDGEPARRKKAAVR